MDVNRLCGVTGRLGAFTKLENYALALLNLLSLVPRALRFHSSAKQRAAVRNSRAALSVCLWQRLLRVPLVLP